MNMVAEVQSWGIESSYIDARGSPHGLEPHVAETLQRSLTAARSTGGRPRFVAVLRPHEPRRIFLPEVKGPLQWRLFAEEKLIASAEASTGDIALPDHLAIGSYRLLLRSEDDPGCDILLLIAPATAYQPEIFRDGAREWLLTVQLYAVRSTQNWGHGDFGDLARLAEIAAKAGASGMGVNPLHALAPGQASPYSPSSRIFLNRLYIDVEAIEEFPGIDACGLGNEIAQLRAADFVDYAAVDAAKVKALRAAYKTFRSSATPERRHDFDAFRTRSGSPLRLFALFETLRERFGFPWQTWPREWQDVSPALARLEAGDLGDIELHAFIQWIADQQLRNCVGIAKRLALPVGLYLDVAVGVDVGGADVWAAPDMLCQNLSIGAPPDVYNPQGQNWGLASFHPQALIDSDFLPFRQMLRSVMHYAGSIRIDHALGLNRLYLIPAGASPADGGYVRFPFAAMLAVIAQESSEARCLTIGEDLGTIPEGVCEALNAWGVWSYRVGLFEREHDGAFRQPDQFTEKAIVTFDTHDLPSFAGWKSFHDLKVKQELGMDPGESCAERDEALKAMHRMLVEQGLAPDLSLLDVLRYLARTHSQLLAVSIEDILGLIDQPNIPGTITEHPNWRRRLPLDLDEIAAHGTLAGVAGAMKAEGRGRLKTA
jgi:4-alpha-glucanotransferase